MMKLSLFFFYFQFHLPGIRPDTRYLKKKAGCSVPTTLFEIFYCILFCYNVYDYPHPPIWSHVLNRHMESSSQRLIAAGGGRIQWYNSIMKPPCSSANATLGASEWQTPTRRSSGQISWPPTILVLTWHEVQWCPMRTLTSFFRVSSAETWPFTTFSPTQLSFPDVWSTGVQEPAAHLEYLPFSITDNFNETHRHQEAFAELELEGIIR